MIFLTNCNSIHFIITTIGQSYNTDCVLSVVQQIKQHIVSVCNLREQEYSGVVGGKETFLVKEVMS